MHAGGLPRIRLRKEDARVTMAALIGLFVGAFVGHMLWQDWGAALGGIAGFLAGAKISSRRRARLATAAVKSGGDATGTATTPGIAMREQDVNALLVRRVQDLERRVASLERANAVGAAAATAPAMEEQEPIATSPLDAPGELGLAAPEPSSIGAPIPEASPTAMPVGPVTATPPPIVEHGPVLPPSPRANALWSWLTGGNALTRIGVVIVFFGVAFLLKYFAEHFTVSIELRLAAVAAFGIALMLLGLRVARGRPGYGLSLQGAGAGILYLTTYAAFRPYGVLPESMAAVLLIAVSALTVGLAVRNDSQPLAALAIAGGFLAPILVGGSGGPLALFGYFAVLNAAIFALAWWRSWRALNVVGFVFTFVLGALWGAEFYTPEHYATVQPFLLLFFALYVVIPIRNLLRGTAPPQDKVDGVLVFGVPIVGFALQAALVEHYRYGAAWSALALALAYAFLFAATRARTEAGFPLLSRAYAALAIIFATIAIPFALDDRYTVAFWSVEAAGVYWIAVRQDARFGRAFALLVEVGAGLVFVLGDFAGADDRLFLNAFFVGAMLIGIAGLVIARMADGAARILAAGERALIPAVFGWGALWWLAAGSVELVRQLAEAEEAHAVLAWITGSVALALVMARVLRWPRLTTAGAVLLPAMAVAAFIDFRLARTTLVAWGFVAWPCAWIVHWWALHDGEALKRRDGNASGAKYSAVDVDAFLNAAHSVSAIALTAQIAWELSEWVGRSTPAYTAWTPCAAALPAIAYLALVAQRRDHAGWPFADRFRAYAIGAGMPIAGFLVLWFFMVNLLSPGNPAPLPYFPLANPLDATLALALWASATWGKRLDTLPERALHQWLGAGIFVALNGVVLRTAHNWADVPWRLSSLLASKPLQAALTLTWTLTALSAMVFATRRRERTLWMVGAALLAVVVAKLFLVDLGNLSGLPRVVAFLGAGVLLLVIGFVSPLPPVAKESSANDGAPPA
jgi:uncharacterized membrane protein